MSCSALASYGGVLVSSRNGPGHKRFKWGEGLWAGALRGDTINPCVGGYQGFKLSLGFPILVATDMSGLTSQTSYTCRIYRIIRGLTYKCSLIFCELFMT